MLIPGGSRWIQVESVMDPAAPPGSTDPSHSFSPSENQDADPWWILLVHPDGSRKPVNLTPLRLPSTQMTDVMDRLLPSG